MFSIQEMDDFRLANVRFRHRTVILTRRLIQWNEGGFFFSNKMNMKCMHAAFTRYVDDIKYMYALCR